MSFMTYLAHASVRMGQNMRQQLNAPDINLLDLPHGHYSISGVTGYTDPNNPSAPASGAWPRINYAPIDLEYDFLASIGYVMLVDVDYETSTSGRYNSFSVTTPFRRVTVQLYFYGIPGSNMYWNNSSTDHMRWLQEIGPLKWECNVTTLLPGNGADVGWTGWKPLNQAPGRIQSLLALKRSDRYDMFVELGNNWNIIGYNPAIPLRIRFNEVRTGGGGWQGRGRFDNIIVITLDTIVAAGTPTFHSSFQPTWLRSFTVTAGKKARLVIDMAGNTNTVYGVDIPGNALSDI